MSIVTLEDVKAHLGVTLDEDDTLIQNKIDAAQASIEQLLGYEIEVRFETAPADLKEAVRQLAAHYFENREASVVGVSVALLPLGIKSIVQNRRDWYGCGADVEES